MYSSSSWSIFQFTPLREGRLARWLYTQPSFSRHFNSRPSARGDSSWLREIDSRGAISIHAPPRGATFQVFCIPTEEIFQFTPLREGRHQFLTGIVVQFISIHAPPRGATPRLGSILSALLHFNSRPSARGDYSAPMALGWSLGFQFTPLREGRPRWLYTQPSFSRHFNSRPSARGDATHTVAASRHKNFNSRPSARGDASALSQPFSPPAFQFTPLREGRLPNHGERLRHGVDFNSRPSARGDSHAHRSRQQTQKFQFTPLREGRQRVEAMTVCTAIFQFTPLREGRRVACCECCSVLNFNSRPSARGDSKRYAISANLLFNPYKSAWLNNNATQFVEIILVIFHRIIA